MAHRDGRGRIVRSHPRVTSDARTANDQGVAYAETWGKSEGGPFFHGNRSARRNSLWRARLDRRRLTLIGLAALLAMTTVISTLYVLGPLNPFARVRNLAELPLPQPSAAYARVAVDQTGWIWVAQSAPGLARNPQDTTLLTLVDPGAIFGSKVRARLCLGCAGMAGDLTTPLARIDDIAPDPTAPHAIFVAGWTAATPQTGAAPLILRVQWHTNAATCSAHVLCGTANTLLTTDTAVLVGGKNPFTKLLGEVVASGANPLITLANAGHGDLYAFLSDPGQVAIDAATDVAGGYQALWHYSAAQRQWALYYHGPAGTVTAQYVGPTELVTAIALNHSRTILYLADALRHAVLALDLRANVLTTPNALGIPNGPYIQATSITLVAGMQAAFPGAPGGQGITGWSGDGGPATAAPLGVPRGLAVDAAGDLLVSDASNGRIRLITPQGKIWTIAGNGAAALGDPQTPVSTSVRGILGLAVDAHGQVFYAPGNIVDTQGLVPLRSLVWGWSTDSHQIFHAAHPGNGTLADPFIGLLATDYARTSAWVYASGACAGASGAGCAASYLVAAGGQNLGQLEPLGPARDPSVAPAGLTATIGMAAPRIAAEVPGSSVIVLADSTPQLAFSIPGGALLPPLILPTGAQATGVAVLAPTTDTQLSALGGNSYLLVAAQGMASGPALLLYRATADTCGMGAEPPATCTRFPSTTTLAATLPLPQGASTGSLVAALSDDGTHAFALVAQPANNIVEAVDLTPFLAGGAPILAAGISIPGPGTMLLRHDNLAAYVVSNPQRGGTSSATASILYTLNTSHWLNTGIGSPASIGDPNPFTLPIAASAPTVAMALSADDTHLYVAGAATTTSPNPPTILAHLTTGSFGAPQPLALVQSTSTDPGVIALGLTAGDQRLVSLSTNGATKPGILRVWETHDLTTQSWAALPRDLGGTPTAANPLILILP